MEQKVKRLKTLNLSKLNRKTFLEPLAKELDIIPLEYKNKQLLKDAIIQKYDLGNPYNKLDPITLCSIQEIPQEYLIKWNQCNNCFAADIRSIKTLFKLNKTILPWVIDFATGVEFSNNKAKYEEIYDMRNVPYLVDKINNFKEEGKDINDPNAPKSIYLRFYIENSTEHYITHIIDMLFMCLNKTDLNN